MVSLFADLRNHRRAAILAAAYSAIIAISFYIAYEVRFDFVVPQAYQLDRLHYIWWVVALKLVALLISGQFGTLLTYFSLPDLARLIRAMVGCSGVLFFLRFDPNLFATPRGVLLVDLLLCLGGLCAVRVGVRVFRERITLGRKASAAGTELIAIVGAGDAGAALARDFINAPSRGFKPIAFFDDDPAKHGKLIHGVPVVGAPESLAARGSSGLAKLVIAMPTAPGRRIREIVRLAGTLKLKVETLPSLEELASGRVRSSRIRPVEIVDLLGREAIDLDSGSIRDLINERVVMVTGAGGSIGSELCRQIAALHPKRLIMVEQSEGNLFVAEQELIELGYGAEITPLVANILDSVRMERIFERYTPEVIFHAAAHKHVFLMERQPAEAINNNVLGTRQLARLATSYHAKAFVLISTDKAINPTSVMGATKRLAELQLQVVHAEGAGKGTKFIAVRFGNVLGSSGSVIPIFKRQIANGGPVTVTHPEVTRYFMTIPEAVGLVLQSAVLGEGGEIFVLDMGRPVKIIDLARQMIELSGLRVDEDIEIKFVGLKPGEKLFEELQHRGESHQSTTHPRIMRFITNATFDESEMVTLERQLHQLEPNEVKRHLQRLVPEYAPYLD